jgi:hypothetical protein
MLILPSHTKPTVQQLDRDIFGISETFAKQDVRHSVKSRQNRKVTRMQLGVLIGRAWNRVASVANTVSAFKATGMYR